MTGAAAAMKVAFVAAMPAPYRLPVWDALALRVRALDVLLCSQREANRVWDVTLPADTAWRWSVLPGIHRYVDTIDWGFHFNPTILKELKRAQPDAIVLSGWDSPTYVSALCYARLRRIPVVLSVETHGMTSQVKRGPIALARRILARAPDAVVAHGRLAEEYLVELGVRPGRIHRGILPIDARRFGAIADAACRPRAAAAPVRLLYVGRLTENKGLGDLLRAFDALPNGTATLTIVGHGPLEEEVRRRAAASPHAIRFLGATATVDDTARVHGDADVMVMPTHRDVWGLVINEGLAAGLYLVSSIYAGASADLVEDAPFDVGRVVDPHDVDALKDALLQACASIRSGAVDREAIARWGRSHTPERLADVFAAAVESAARRPAVA